MLPSTRLISFEWWCLAQLARISKLDERRLVGLTRGVGM